MTDDKPRRRRRRKKRPVKWKGGRSRPTKNYRTEEYIDTIAHAEAGIYQGFVVSDYTLTDRDVRRSLKGFVRELREQGYVPAEERDTVEVRGDKAPEDLITGLIKLNWDRLFERQPRHSDEDLIGCLGVVLDSVETWSSPAQDSRGYLWYCAGFTRTMGMRVEMLSPSPEDEVAWEEEEAERTDEDILRDLAEEWLLDSTPKQFDSFQRQARAMLDDGQAQEVINVCQYLIGWVNDQAIVRRLTPLLKPAYGQLGVPFQHRGRS